MRLGFVMQSSCLLSLLSACGLFIEDLKGERSQSAQSSQSGTTVDPASGPSKSYKNEELEEALRKQKQDNSSDAQTPNGNAQDPKKRQVEVFTSDSKASDTTNAASNMNAPGNTKSPGNVNSAGNETLSENVSSQDQTSILQAKKSAMLKANERLEKNDYLISANGLFTFAFQEDGNACIYKTAVSEALWCSNSHAKGANFMLMQGDGNLVIYRTFNSSDAVWDTGAHENLGSAYLVMQDDGNAVVYSGGSSAQVYWDSKTGGR